MLKVTCPTIMEGIRRNGYLSQRSIPGQTGPFGRTFFLGGMLIDISTPLYGNWGQGCILHNQDGRIIDNLVDPKASGVDSILERRAMVGAGVVVLGGEP